MALSAAEDIAVAKAAARARDLYSVPAFRETTDFDQIKRHYFATHPHLNPSRIVPEGPVLGWDAPHERERLAARHQAM
jgi:putative glutathione S-transferase